MHRFTLPLVILGSVLLAALLTWLTVSTVSFTTRVDAPAIAVTAKPLTQALPPFRRIEVAGTAEVTLVQGDGERVTSAAGDGGALVSASVRDGTLHLEASDDGHWWDWLLDRDSARAARITVVFRNLDAIAAAGTVKVVVAGLRTPALAISGAGGTSIDISGLAADELTVSGAGALRAVLAGTVTTQTVTIAGAGEYRAADLVSRDATVTVTGAGQVLVRATHTLHVVISGAGEVEYLGDPEVTERVSGIGRVKRGEPGAAPAKPAGA
ncbi:MAG: DUF2807 domain-containing protein [Burkholderiales bacterium]|nr:DUF2807 domain-containing protein [Burkholderiales bacterium]